MKTFFSTLAVLFTLSTISLAQLNKGSIHIAGSSDLSFSSMKTRMEYDGEQMGEKASSSNFNFKPELGYLVADNFVIGLSFSYEHSKMENETTTQSIIGPYAKYYFGSTNVRPFLRGDLGFGAQNEEDGGDEFKADLFAYALGGGVAVFIGKSISLDFGLGYVNATISSPEDSKTKIITDGIAITAGFSLYL